MPINELALSAIDAFFSSHPHCAEVIGSMVRAAAKGAFWVDPTADEAYLSKSGKDIGLPDKDRDTTLNDIFYAITPGGRKIPLTIAYTNSKTNTVYVSLKEAAYDGDEEITYIHEGLHLVEGTAYNSHTAVARWLGLGEFSSDGKASVAIDNYLKGDCHSGYNIISVK